MMTKKKLLTIAAPLTLALGLAAGSVALADDGHQGRGRHGMMMKRFDANGDGKLDEKELAAAKAAFEARKAERMARLDANKDGTVDEAERAAFHKERVQARFKALDTDGNGQISLAEFEAGAGHQGRGFHHRGGK